MSRNKEKYGPPLEDSKKIVTTKQVLQGSSSSSTQNRFTPLTPMPLPAFYPKTSLLPQPRALRPHFYSQLVSSTSIALGTQTNQKPLAYYTPPLDLTCPFLEKDYRKILFLLEPEYEAKTITQITSQFYSPGLYFLPL